MPINIYVALPFVYELVQEVLISQGHQIIRFVPTDDEVWEKKEVTLILSQS